MPPGSSSPFSGPPEAPGGWLRVGRALRTWLWMTLAWVAVGLLFTTQFVVFGGGSWALGWRFALLDWGPWIVLTPLVWWLAHRAPVAQRSWRWAVPVHVVAAIGVAVLFELVSTREPLMPPSMASRDSAARSDRPPMEPPNWGGPGSDMSPGAPGGHSADGGGPSAGVRSAPYEMRQPPEPGEWSGGAPGGTTPDGRPGGATGGPGMGGALGDRGTGDGPGGRPGGPQRPATSGRSRLALPVYLLIVAAAHAWEFHRRSLVRERQARQAESLLVEARMMALQNQLQPHFFFNALNCVAGLVHTQPAQAEEMICALGELMRGVLALSDKRDIPLRDELAFIARYLAVQRIRFGDRLRVREDVAPETLDLLVPALILQPLVENAVVHGVARLRTTGAITLHVRREADTLRISILNPVPDPVRLESGFKRAAGVGLRNTRERLDAAHGRDARLDLRLGADGLAVAEMLLPARPAPPKQMEHETPSAPAAS